VGVYQYLEPTLDMLDSLRRGSLDGFVHGASKAPLHRPLYQAALDYALIGTTTLDEARRIGGEVDIGVRS
jgi:MSHA biogenesis protein MshE